MAISEKSKNKSVEFMLINVKTETMSGGEMSFLGNQNLLNDPNIMIEDTGATCESTAWHDGMINMKSAGAQDTITASNGEEIRRKKL